MCLKKLEKKLFKWRIGHLVTHYFIRLPLISTEQTIAEHVHVDEARHEGRRGNYSIE